MGNLCSRPSTYHYQPTWQQRDRHGAGHVEGAGQSLQGEEIVVPRKASPRARSRVNNGLVQTTLTDPSKAEGGHAGGDDAVSPATPAAPQPAAAQLCHTNTPLPEGQPVQWVKGDLLGAGAFGRVYAGLDEATGQLMAVKQVLLCKDNSLVGKVNEQVVSLEKEVAVLKQLDHPNIVRYLGTERTEEHLNIFLEFVSGGSIASLLAKFGSLKELLIKIYTRQILTGLEYLHQHQIMHRDIKGANILVDTRGLIKLADFGASRKIEELVTLESNQGAMSIKGTPYWMAPEVIKQSGHGRSADIWSVACTVIEMATGKPPWSQFNSQVSALFHIASSKGPPPIPEHLSPEAKDFLLLCFNREPRERPNATRLLKHPWLADTKPTALGAPLSLGGSGPLGGRAPRLFIASPVRAGNAPPISPIEEEPEHGSAGGPPWRDTPHIEPMAAAAHMPDGALPSPLLARQAAHGPSPDHPYAQRQGPSLPGPPVSGGLLLEQGPSAGRNGSPAMAQAAPRVPLGESPGPLGMNTGRRVWDAPGYGFGLHSPAVRPERSPGPSQPAPSACEAADDPVRASAGPNWQIAAAARKQADSPTVGKAYGHPIIHIQAAAAADPGAVGQLGTGLAAMHKPSTAVQEDDEAGSGNSSMESGSFNPVEEPSWLHTEQFDFTRYGVTDSISSSPRNPVGASLDLAATTDRACRATLPRTPSSNSNMEEPGSPSMEPPLVESPRLSLRRSGGAGLDEVQAFVAKKASVDFVRLSIPFKEQSLNIPASGEVSPSKLAKWEAELYAELAEQRALMSGRRGAGP